MTDESALAKALTAFHKELPKVGKGSTNPAFKSKYADLADIVSVVLLALAKNGLAWITTPRVSDDGFVLDYELRHTSGESVTGSWPLPDPEKATPQQMGSAVTYAKRYTLSAVTGIAPDEDDDGNAASNGPGAAPRRAKQAPAGERIAAARAAIEGAKTTAELDKVWERVRQGGLDGIAELISVHDDMVADLRGTEDDASDKWAPVAPIPEES